MREETILRTADAARYVNLAVSTLEKMRVYGGGQLSFVLAREQSAIGARTSTLGLPQALDARHPTLVTRPPDAVGDSNSASPAAALQAANGTQKVEQLEGTLDFHNTQTSHLSQIQALHRGPTLTTRHASLLARFGAECILGWRGAP
jgi:hypothetical protein